MCYDGAGPFLANLQRGNEGLESGQMGHRNGISMTNVPCPRASYIILLCHMVLSCQVQNATLRMA